MVRIMLGALGGGENCERRSSYKEALPAQSEVAVDLLSCLRFLSYHWKPTNLEWMTPLMTGSALRIALDGGEGFWCMRLTVPPG